MTVSNIIFFAICTILIMTAVYFIGILLNYKIARDTINFHMLELQLKTPINSNVSQLLDEFIEDCFTDYLALDAELLNYKYINEDQETKIVNNVVNLVADRISTTMHKQLSVYYNEKAIPEIISTKIYELTISYVVQFNQDRESVFKSEEG